MMKFYGYKKCSSCRDAMKWLDSHGTEYTSVSIIETPPTQMELKQALAAGFTLRNLFNTSGIQYRELKMKDKIVTMSETEALKTLASNGYLVKRPLAIGDDGKVTVGFKSEKYAEVWGR